MKVWLTVADAADVANRSERTIRNWVRDGALAPRVRGLFARDDVLAAERQMRNGRGRPTATAPRLMHLWGEQWAYVKPCGTHRRALESGLVAISCLRCSIRQTAELPEGTPVIQHIERYSDG